MIRAVRRARGIALVAAFFAAGPARAADYTGVHTVGIIVALGDVFTRSMDARFSAYDLAERVPVSGWDIDEQMGDTVAETIYGRFAIKAVNYGATEFHAVGSDGRDTRDSIEMLVRGMPASNAVDAYVIVHKIAAQSAREDAKLRGLGVHCRDFVWQGVSCDVYAFYAVTIADARDGHVIATSPARLPKAEDGSEEPVRTDPSGEWTGPFVADGAQEIAPYRAGLFSLLRDSLPVALAGLELPTSPTLVPATPPPSQTPTQ
ncbi:MAG: hypothetical protein GC166_09435 [Alphaproteobacteria bacterium]|nr:hypothetical protein [Alphaproteobacteria bacterium]